MCGLVGFISKKYYYEFSEELDLATSCLSHRGPNDSGLFFASKAGVGLGHRRLSVIDLSAAGHQPMTNNDVNYI